MPDINYEQARSVLEETFAEVEQRALDGEQESIDPRLAGYFGLVFGSRTQAYREVLVGCVLARLQDKTIDIHKPYVNQGDEAYNGRTLDERVVNPFLHEKRVPCSRGPFLSTFRRSVEFRPSTRDGLRDKEGFDALLVLIDHVARETDDAKLVRFLRSLLFWFLELRKGSEVPLSRLSQVSVEQYHTLIARLLSVPSGGRFPVMFVEVTFAALKHHFKLDWEIESHGINVADRPAGASGDIVIRSRGAIVLAAEVTERPVDKDRVVATFQTKIAPQGIEDYLFFVKTPTVNGAALKQARLYFSQGHEVNFLQIANWICTLLTTVGKEGRAIFGQAIIDRLSRPDVPPGLKVAWNEQLANLTTT